MLSEKVLLALNDLDDSDIETVGQLMGYGRRKSNTHRRKTARRVMLLAAVVAAFLAFCAVAYAANIWGIREMFRTPHRELPEAAAEILQEQTETGENEGLRCRVTESVCDASSAMVTVAVTVSDRYIAVPTDAMPDFPAAYYGFTGREPWSTTRNRRAKPFLWWARPWRLRTFPFHNPSQSKTFPTVSWRF